MPGEEQVAAWKGRETLGSDGERTGTVETVFVDEAGTPAWVAVTPGVLSTRVVLVPAAGAVEEGELVRLAHDKATIEAAPDGDADAPPSPEAVRRLREHYGA